VSKAGSLCLSCARTEPFPEERAAVVKLLAQWAAHTGAALRRLVERDPEQLALKAILERLELQEPEPIPEAASAG
jgi:hypothetical protein